MTTEANAPELNPPESVGLEPVGRHGRPQAVASTIDANSVRPQTTVTTYPLSFTGTAAEYFRIWIVNVALTIVTLGIYTPWARVRTRQYFYGNTWLDGHNFEYTANPIALLRGYLIVALFFGAYSAAMQFQFSGWEWVVGIVAILFIATYPWLVRQSLRFLARSSVHRGLNFRFDGSLSGAYVAYGAANIAASFSASLALPWAWFMQRRYQMDNLHYGSARGKFRGEVGPFYLIGLTGLGMTVAGGVLLGTVFFMLAGVAGVFGWLNSDTSGEMSDAATSGLIAGIVGIYLSIFLLYGIAWQYIRAATMSYVLNNLELGGVVRTKATFSPWMMVWIGISNTVARIVSLGLLSPWAAIRKMKYIAENVQVRAIASLDDFRAANVQDESALGEAATELLDINLGF